MSLSERISRVIRGGGAWQPLQISKLGGARFAPPPSSAVDEAAIEARIAAAFQEGLAEGRFRAESEARERERQQGLAAGQRWERLLDELAQGMHDIEAAAADRLLDLTTLLATTIACREISLAPDRITPVLEQALKLITGACRQLEVIAHPSDCAAIETWLRPRCGEAQLTSRADAAVAPGGCLLRADDTTLDATLQTRIGRTLAALGIAGAPADAVLAQAFEAGEAASPAAAQDAGGGAPATQPGAPA